MKLSKLCFAIAVALTVFSCKTESTPPELTEREDGMEQAMIQQFKRTRDPYLNIVPAERLAVAREKMNQLQSARGMNIQALSWTERGPNNIGGRTRAMFIDHRDATGNTVFAASVSGGIFRTTTFNTTPIWVPLTDNLSNNAVTAMVQHPTDGNIMYAGTGEGWFNVDAVKGAGIFKSTDGGQTWTKLSATNSWDYVQDLAIDNNGNLYATVRNNVRGVYRSTNGGASFSQVITQSMSASPALRGADLEVASNGDVYATLGVFTRSQVFKSSFAVNGTNTGALGTWIEITPSHGGVTQRAELAIAPSNPDRLYLLLQDSASQQVKFIYRSTNAGITWDSVVAPPAINNSGFSQTWYNLIAAVDPTNPNALVVGGLHLARSSDAGANWMNISSSSFVHVDQHVLIYKSASNLIVGNDGGIYSANDVNSGSPTFIKKNNGFNVTQFYGVDYHPLQPNYFLAGAQDNNTQQFTSPGLNTTNFVVGGDGGFPHIRQTDGALQIAATTNNNFYLSLNGGVFTKLGAASNERGQFINASDLADAENVLYSGDDPGWYYVITGLNTSPLGFAVFVNEIGSSREVTAVKVDPFTPNTIWLGTNSIQSGVSPRIIKLSNAHTNSPTVLASSIIGLPAGATISSIDVDPNNSSHAIATASNYGVTSVFETTNGGLSWSSIEGDLPDMPVYWGIFAPANAVLNGTGNPEGGIILATELGVWSTSQIGGPFSPTSWMPQNNGFPNVRTDMIRYRVSDRMLVAATHGRGLFTTTIPQGTSTVGVPNITVTKDFIRYVPAVSNKLMIVPGTLNTRKLDLQVFDLSGRLIHRQSGPYQATSVNTSSWSRGSYVIKIRGDRNEQYVKQFIKE